MKVSNCTSPAMAGFFKLAISAPAVSAPQPLKNRRFSLQGAKRYRRYDNSSSHYSVLVKFSAIG